MNKSNSNKKPAGKTSPKSTPKPSGKTSPKSTPKASAESDTKKNKASGVGVIRDFDTIPPAVSGRVYTQSYDFGSLKEGKGLFVPVEGGSSKEEKAAIAKKIRSNIFAAFYRFRERNEEAKTWSTAVRIITDDSGLPSEVGFYRGSGQAKTK
jgi:hypothetical protein